MKQIASTVVRRSALSISVGALTVSLAQLFGDVPPTTQPATTLPAAAAVAATGPTTAPAGAAVIHPSSAPALAGQVSGEVDRLIKKLGDDDSDLRDAAQKQLIDLGPVAIPGLKQAVDSSTDPEIRSRAAAALAAMKNHVDNDATLITLHMKEASASDVLAALSKQCSAQIISNGVGKLVGADNRSITVDADAKPFWDVMTDISNQLNVCPRLDVTGRGQMQLVTPVNGRNWTQSPHQLTGPFWISAASVYRARTIDLQGPVANPAIDDQFSVKLIIYPEPKLAVAQISDLILKEATDNAGHSLLPKPLPPNAARAAVMLRTVTSGLAGLGQMNRTIESRLNYPDNPGTRIALLRGEVEVQLGSDIQQYIVDDVLGSPKVVNPLKNCNVQVAVTKQSPASQMYIVNLTCTRDGLSDEQWSALINRSNDVTMEDAEGHPLTAFNRYSPMPSSETSFRTMLYFSTGAANAIALVRPGIAGVAGGAAAVAGGAKVGDPKRLIWSVATSLKTIKVPVELKDLPMP